MLRCAACRCAARRCAARRRPFATERAPVSPAACRLPRCELSGGSGLTAFRGDSEPPDVSMIIDPEERAKVIWCSIHLCCSLFLSIRRYSSLFISDPLSIHLFASLLKYSSLFLYIPLYSSLFLSIPLHSIRFLDTWHDARCGIYGCRWRRHRSRTQHARCLTLVARPRCSARGKLR